MKQISLRDSKLDAVRSGRGPRHAHVQVLRLLLNATKPVYTNAVPWGTTNRPK